MVRTALVTGAAGFVGRYLVRALREAGWRTTTLDLHGPADITGDLARVPLRHLQADVAFHLAGFSNPTASVEAAWDSYRANTEATGRLVRDCSARRFVLASSCQVYGAPSKPADEELRPFPLNPYSASKLCGEALALASGKDVVVLRPFNHTGPGQSEAYVCPRIARQIARAEAGLGPARVEVGDLSHRRDFFDVRDMVRAYLAAADRGRAGAVYNVATGRPVTIGEIVRMLIAESRVRMRLVARRGRATLLSGNTRRFQADTGWSAKIPLQQTLRDILEYERERLRSP